VQNDIKDQFPDESSQQEPQFNESTPNAS